MVNIGTLIFDLPGTFLSHLHDGEPLLTLILDLHQVSKPSTRW